MLDDPQGRLRGDAATYQMIVGSGTGADPRGAARPAEPGPQLDRALLP